MKLITRDTDYAIRALRYMAERKGRVVSAGQLVDALKIPRPFLRKLLQVLHKKGILSAYKGKGGGFELAKPAGEIVVAEIAGIFQGGLRLNECVFKRKLCPNRSTCALRRELADIERYALDKLSAVSIASLGE